MAEIYVTLLPCATLSEEGDNGGIANWHFNYGLICRVVPCKAVDSNYRIQKMLRISDMVLFLSQRECIVLELSDLMNHWWNVCLDLCITWSHDLRSQRKKSHISTKDTAMALLQWTPRLPCGFLGSSHHKISRKEKENIFICVRWIILVSMKDKNNATKWVQGKICPKLSILLSPPSIAKFSGKN